MLLSAQGRDFDHGETGRVPLGEREHHRPGLVVADHRHDVGEKRAGGVELGAVDDDVASVAIDRGAEERGVRRAALAERIAEADALEQFDEQVALLLFHAVEDDVDQVGELVLRQLPERGVGCRDDLEDLGHGDIGHAGPAVRLGDRDAPKPALRTAFHFGSVERASRISRMLEDGCLAGWHAASGSLRWSGRAPAEWPAADRARAVQLVGQIPSQHLSGRAFTVRDEIAFGPENLGMAVKAIERLIERSLSLAGLEALADRDPFKLSGGEQQRLVLAAALALEPQFLLLDEPFTNLDPESRHRLMRVLLELAAGRPSWCSTPIRRSLSASRTASPCSTARIAVQGDARAVLLDPRTSDALGRPSVARAVRELDPDRGIADADLSLTLKEAERCLRRERACRA